MVKFYFTQEYRAYTHKKQKPQEFDFLKEVQVVQGVLVAREKVGLMD